MNTEKDSLYGLTQEEYGIFVKQIGADNRSKIRGIMYAHELDKLELENWDKKDVPQAQLIDFDKIGRKNPYGMGISGYVGKPANYKNHGLVVAGFDKFVVEDKPKKNEPEGNAYHFFVFKNPKVEGKYLIAELGEPGIPHHHKYEDLGNYNT